MKKIVLAILLSLPSFSFATTITTLTYQGFDGTGCTTAYSILVYIPAGAGPFPVHVHTVGSFAAYTGVEAPDILANMSSRGYISASVEYLSGNGSGSYDCTSISKKTQCIYDTSSANSAISKICALPQADCSQGILVSGMSQGAQFATLANNYDAGVKAAYVISDGDTTYGLGAADFTGCVDAGHRTLPANLLRAVSGESDAIFGNSGAMDASSIRTTLQNLTGQTCTPTSFSCFRADGSGWYEIQDNETTGNNADHCYELGSSCFSSAIPDAKWAPPSASTWSMIPNLDWLSSYLPIHPLTAFTATATTIAPGQSTRLSWTTSAATTVVIDQGIGAVATNGSVTVNPSVTTTYTLTASSGNGSTVKTLTVTVNSTAMARVRVFPNPWRNTSGVSYITFDGLASGDSVKLFTMSGRWIKTLPASASFVSWSLDNDSGDHVASGMYFYLITDAQGNKTKGKLTVIR